MGAPEFFLAFAFGIHILMVNIGIALATIIPFLEWKARKLSDTKLLSNAKNLFKIYAATYGLAGVFGTAFTVFLLSYYPEFIGVAGAVTLYPFGIAILFITLHFFSIVTYWYGWDRFSANTHLTIGALLAFSAYMIPFGFRSVFAFLNTPTGLLIKGSKLELDLMAALANPTFPPLYLKSIVGALIVGFLFVAAVYAYKKYKGELDDPAIEEELILKPVEIAAVLLIIQAFLGAWYIASLALAAPYKFNNIFAALGLRACGPSPAADYSWLFILKMAFVAAQFLAIIYVLSTAKNGVTATGIEAVKLAAASAALGLITGEYLNAFSQYPYFVAALPQIATKIPEPWRTLLARALDLRNANILTADPGLIAFTAVFLAALLAAALYFIYVVFFKRASEK